MSGWLRGEGFRGLEGCVRWRDRWEFVWRPRWSETAKVEGWYGFAVVDGGFGREKKRGWYFIRSGLG